MLDEGVYLFFDDEIARQGESSSPFPGIRISDRFVKDIENEYARCEVESNADESDVELRPLSGRKFGECCRKAKTVVFICIRSLTELELAFADSTEMADRFRRLIYDNKLLFVAELWDANFFWTGTSVRQWFNARFPVDPEEVKYTKPPSVLDLLYEFIESVPHSQDNRLTLKETLLTLSDEDRLFVEDLLSGKNPKQNSTKTEETSARILRALMENKV